MRLARAALAAAVAFAPVAAVALPARQAAAAECVRVVVDYGTSSGANTHCTTASPGATAAEVLATRAREVGRTPPRYRGNFLCAIDGYPETGCGDHGTEPYWSLWLWVDGRWVYSSLGVDSYTVRDSDRDGHPDPIGFRYHEFETKRSPRANPSYPKPTTAPPASPAPRATSAPPPARPGATAPAAGPGVTAPATTAASPREATAGPSGTPVGTPAGPGATGTPSAAGSPSASGETPEAVATFAQPPVSSTRAGGGLPAGTVAAALLAVALLGAAAYRARRSA